MGGRESCPTHIHIALPLGGLRYESKVDRRGFDSLVILVSWLLWKERNGRTFDRRVRTVDDLVLRVCDEVVAWSHAGYRQLESALATSGVFSGRAIVTE